MHKLLWATASVLALAAAGTAGYRLGTGVWPDPIASVQEHYHAPAERAGDKDRTVLYWRDPDGKPDYSPTPTKTEDGRNYLPVYDEEEPLLPGDKVAATAKAAAKGGEREVLNYAYDDGTYVTDRTADVFELVLGATVRTGFLGLGGTRQVERSARILRVND